MRSTLWSRAAAVAAALVVAVGAPAMADTLTNTLDNTIADNALETVNISAGQSATVGMELLNQNKNAGDTVNNCNVSAQDIAVFTVTSSDPAVATAPPTLSVNACDKVFPLQITANSGGSATFTFTKLTAPDGLYDTAPASFTVNVPVTNHAPAVSVTGVTDGKTYEAGSSVPTAMCHVVDTEDGTKDFPATLGTPTAITGGTRTQASCSYTDAGGLKGTASATYSVVDTTPPTITLDSRTQANAAGWNNSDVMVKWACTDSGSGVVDATITKTVSTEGAGQQASAHCVDKAGNTSADNTVNDIKIDKTAPTAGQPAYDQTASSDGWYNHDVTVTWTCSDTGGSGLVSSTVSDKVTTDGSTGQAKATCADQAGNTTAVSSAIKLDKSAPTITLNTPDANGQNGWDTKPVTVTWTCADSGSGATGGGSQTLDRDGTGQSVTGTCTDAAGNSSSATTSREIKIDQAAPGIQQNSRTPKANDEGWNNGPVTVTWACTDTGSGNSADTVSSTVAAEGGNQTAEGTCTDNAGNTASAKQDGIKIDRTGPTVTMHTPDPTGNDGWYTGDVDVTWTCSDNLSGATTEGGHQTVSEEGTSGSATGTCADNADNENTGHVADLKIDKTAPSVTDITRTAANPNGWNNGDVDIAWKCSDDTSGAVTSSGSQKVTKEGADQSTTATCTDNAGNFASQSVDHINIDKTTPKISMSKSGQAGLNDWYVSPVTVGWSCTDALSKGTEDSSQVLGKDGANQRVDGSCTDLAGNTATDSVTGINIDQTAPTASATSYDPATPGSGWYTGDVKVTWTCADATSGIADNAKTVTGTASGEGKAVTARGDCVDQAGNTGHVSSTVSIDGTAPEITMSVPEVDGDNGWNLHPVTVTWNCDDGLSGAAAGDREQTLAGDTDAAGQKVTARCADIAGNTSSMDSRVIKIDKTAPGIEQSGRTPANANGWNRGPVTVSWACTDDGSGNSADTVSDTVNTEGENESVSGTCTDNAGNSTSATQDGINIDRTQPDISMSQDGQRGDNGWYTGDVDVTWTCTDKLSGATTEGGQQTVSEEGTSGSASGTCADKAGNENTGNVTHLKIDQTAPSVTDITRTPANHDGWNNTDVDIAWKCADATSGPLNENGSTTLTEDKADQSTAATCTDNAGNRASQPVEHINIDKTDPVIEMSKSGAPGQNGWYVSPVTVGWKCSDALSGGTTDGQTVLRDDTKGTDVPGSCTDKAGNTANDSVTGIKIDKTAPTASAPSYDPTTPGGGGWYTGDVKVTWTCTDPTSGIADNAKTVTGTASGEGKAVTATGRCVDQAGNTGDVSSTVDIDRSAPTITMTVPEADGSNGWNVHPVKVTWNCDDQLSGPATGDREQTLSTDTAGQKVTARCADIAGNTSSADSRVIKIDKTAPGISYVGQSPAATNGWTNGDTTLTWKCTDGVSGVDGTDTPTTTVTGEGSGLQAVGGCTDKAGNSASNGQSVNIDRHGPEISWTGGPADGASYTYGNVPATPTCAATDNLSGVSGDCSVTGYDAEVGSYTLTATATDKAGNTTTAKRTYQVTPWTLKGFYSPVDMGGTVNTVKAGSTVPLKFEVFSGTNELKTVDAVRSFNAQTRSCTTGATDPIDMTTTGGTALRFDTSADQFVQNWKTPAATGCYQVTMTTQDNSTLVAQFKLK